MTRDIHPTAIVDSGAIVGADCKIGPYAVIGAHVELGAHCQIGAHAVLEGPTRIGSHNHIFQFASVGTAPQDLGYQGEPTALEIGSHNTLREFVTVNRGTVKGGGVTRIGSHNLLMAYCHVAHDCRIGDQVVMANAATLAGHVCIEDHAILGGLSAVHQFARIGSHAILGGGTMAPLDIPPYMMAAGNHASLHGINVRGLARRGISRETILQIKRAYRILFRSGQRLDDAMEEVRQRGLDAPEIAHLLDFIQNSKRGITRP
ncbi:acyl-ACP--UDP-N-acetylglucosamine O-acyltransferase [Acidithiobacillus thiooxidans]|jgi:UDP-N-acetylglucosamine acyltransferase|uniref:Acyl-[acyl-carrier-protein]--UDP-N-acetylglucosamine O-acyltransferase n=2 Tax=Acidithiobacillus thiooxidans TaxID=930 RepID=A0A543Q2K7_ACITH|nr:MULTISPECIES: acyl-ACP--UDP-N-acetylglucosamine O-acyltransferase [Acidithiobacillus]MBE7565613.1 acyl-ACP--UDP-N-acetylglucosamine O-acyltransferase [Acidithiobacillus sp. HP-11]MBU2740091.1 acyl-ACP--UDP-N-acetylglucosamine O-acyltransferase [Acidithiobacillus albertensis]MBU2751294.1 acyl-ACP--UDP-N-acetylglucosamine O-acyltransferase [Acidithiobacillus thiooxidans]MBU2792935.1 acyl-ACP--UDP-N-acetylglucosamine O-acyltransferase [Acidithiobacillus thiooxidans]MBU2835992.1 acyl-ACP--UDP-N